MNQQIYEFIIDQPEDSPEAIRRKMLHEIGVAAPIAEIKSVLDFRRDMAEINNQGKTKDGKSMRGQYVSRSAYQKLAEELKTLKRDLRIICLNPGIEALMLRLHYRKKFRKETQGIDFLKKLVTEEINLSHDAGSQSHKQESVK